MIKGPYNFAAYKPNMFNFAYPLGGVEPTTYASEYHRNDHEAKRTDVFEQIPNIG